MRGIKPPGGRYLQFYAVDLGRGPDGRWWVLDDRTQSPSGAGYALENRLVLSRAYPKIYTSMNVQRLAGFFNNLRQGTAAAAARSDPRICLMTPGPFSETYFEQAHIARYLGFLLVEGADLVVRDGRCLRAHHHAGLKRVDVIWAARRRPVRRPAGADGLVASRHARPGRGHPRQGGVAVR